MVQLINQTCDIQRVRTILPCDGGVQVIFSTGLSVCLRKGHPEYEQMLQQARRSLESEAAVGFLVSEAGELAELNYTHQSAVRHVRPDEDDPNRLLVEFWTYSPICYLTKDHPEFARSRHTLECAATMDQPVTWANHVQMVEGETETWWKIMDVRLAQVPLDPRVAKPGFATTG